MCPYCCGEDTKVVESRKHDGAVERKRKCLDRVCGQTFFTTEKANKNRKWPQGLIDKSLARVQAWKETN